MPVSQVVQVIRSSASVSRLSSFLELLWSSEIWLEIAYMYTLDMSFNSIAAFSNCPDVDLDWLNWPNLTTCLFWEFSISPTITFSFAKVVFLTPGDGTTSIGWNPGCPIVSIVSGRARRFYSGVVTAQKIGNTPDLRRLGSAIEDEGPGSPSTGSSN